MGRPGGTPNGGAGPNHGGEPVAAVQSRLPAMLEVEDGLEGLGCKNRKVQGLHCKVKFSTILGLK
jgi:hypothetical protein